AADVFTGRGGGLDGEPGPAPVLRRSDGFLTDAVWDEGLGVALDNLLLAFSRLSEGAAMIADRLSLDDPSERRAQLVGELRGVVRRLDAAAAGLTATLRPPAAGPAAVRWLERRGRKTPNVSLAAGRRIGPRRRRRARTRGAGPRIGRRHVRAVHEPCGVAPGGGGGARLGRRPVAPVRAGRRAARPPAATLPGGRLGDSAWNGLVLGGRRRTRARAARADSREAALQGTDGAAHGRAAGAVGGAWLERLRALPRPQCGPEAQAGVRAPDPQPRGRGGGRAAGPPRGYEALRRNDPRRLASGDAAGGP